MTRSLGAGRAGGDRGQAGGLEVLPFAALLLLGAVLVLANAWAVVDGRFAAETAAREAVRWVAESVHVDRSVADIRAGATAVALGTLGPHGDGRAPAVTVAAVDGSLHRCARVRVTVEFTVPAIRIPVIGGFDRGVVVSASHEELVDPTRSGVPGEARCIR